MMRGRGLGDPYLQSPGAALRMAGDLWRTCPLKGDSPPDESTARDPRWWDPLRATGNNKWI